MNFKKYLARSRSAIDSALDRFLPKEDREPKVLHRAMRYSVFSGGKRIRPVIVIESARACGASQKDAMAAACAVELVHTYSLVHDDLPSMDDDDFRRGKPTSHKAFGEANAILSGDGLLTLAFNIIARHSKPSAAASMAAELSEAIGTRGMVGGQAADIEFQEGKKNAAKLEYINCLKTAKLFEASAKLGAIAAGSGVKKIRAMASYGMRLGAAFQMVDDIMDNDGYARLFGAEKARHDAGELIKKAKEAIRPFGKRAGVLSALADYVMDQAG
jgi:geranylgeranyl diphosphate synthase type II